MPDAPPPSGGMPPAGMPAPSAPGKTSGLAIASLVLGILACPLSCLTAIPGLICGIVGLVTIRKSETAATGPRLSGRGLAITGIVLSGLSILIAPLLVVVGLLLPAVGSARQAAQRIACLNNLKQIGLGAFMFESTHGCMPANIVDADGTPLLSWRVAILPHLEETALYEEFRLDEPWDSPHNLALVERMPAVFACPNSTLQPGDTTYLGAAGPGMALGEPSRTVRAAGNASVVGVRVGDMNDGTSRTILVLEMSPDRAVPWTKPDDLTVSPDDAVSLLEDSTSHDKRLRPTLFVDGHVEILSDDIDPEVFKALLTRSGGEKLPANW